MQTINASSFCETSDPRGLTLFHSSARDSYSIKSIADALSPSYWHQRFTPFACAISDDKTGEIVLVRDHLGVAPLYYWHEPRKKLIFADNLPDILRHLPSTPALVEAQVRNLFAEAAEYSDETLYTGIYRVEPGHLIHIKSDGTLVKKAFWKLERDGEPLQYKDDRDYLEHFSQLMQEAVLCSTRGHNNVAAEFSAGLDSSAVYCAARGADLKPTLYMQGAAAGSDSAKIYNDKYEKAFIEHYQLNDIRRIAADQFDPIPVFVECTSWFAGPPPYIYPMFAHPLHRAVAAGKHPILLSGFGGDQGVSGSVPLQFLLPNMIHRHEFRKAWREIPGRNPLGKIGQSAKYAHPVLFELAISLQNMRRAARKQPSIRQPYHTRYFRSLREAEWAFLQGPLSHEVRMRIEYSSVLSKKLGFEYRYPLLYPKLLEFFLSIPHMQKRRDGAGRYLIRRYLAEQTSEKIFESYKKREGLGIFPGSFDLFKEQFEQGRFQEDFKALPYPRLIQHKRPHSRLTNTVKAFMLKNRILTD